MPALEFFELVTDVWLRPRRSLYESKTLQLVDRCDRRRECQWVRFVGVAVGEVVILEELCDLLARCAETKRNVGRSDSLRGDQDVRDDSPVVHCKPLAGAPPSRHHLVGDEEDAVFVAYTTKLGHVLIGRNDDTIRADDRLD